MSQGESQNGRITLEGMTFHAYHGVYQEEQIKGNTFSIDVSFEINIHQASQSDNLDHTVDYVGVYEVIANEMKTPSALLEHVAMRILQAIKEEFPAIRALEISIRKLNPPLLGPMQAVALTIREKQ